MKYSVISSYTVCLPVLLPGVGVASITYHTARVQRGDGDVKQEQGGDKDDEEEDPEEEKQREHGDERTPIVVNLLCTAVSMDCLTFWWIA